MRASSDASVTTHETIRRLMGVVGEREYGGVSAELLAVSLSEVRALSLADRSSFHFLYARYLYTRGEYRRAHARVRCAIRLCRAGSDHVLFARAKHLCGSICRNLGRVEEAAELFIEAFVSHKRACNNQAACLPLISLGLLHFYAGDLRQARKVLSDALSFAKRFCSNATVNDCAYNLSIVDMLSGHFAECQTLLDMVRSQPQSMLDDAYRTRYSGQLAAWLLQTNEAREQIKLAMVAFAREHIQRDYVVCLEYLGMNEYFAGNYQKAKEYYEQVLAMPEPTASAVAQTLRMLADVQIAEGEWKKAEETAAKAEIAITKIKERIELGALYRAYGQINAHRDRREQAREYFGKSIDLLKELGARYELALSHFVAGQSQVFSESERKEQLELAKSLFAEMGVPKRVAQVEAVLADLERTRPQGRQSRSVTSSTTNPDIITGNPEMLRLLDHAARFAATKMTVLITGETGTGKDLLARRIHCLSPRSTGPFRNENMSRFPRDLVDSELFGYEKGSHSLADKGKAGLIELTDGGTFCLNEVADLPLEMQTRLLQVIEEGVVRRVGGGEPRQVDVRFIAITNCDLEQRAQIGQFRHDLLFRLRCGHLHLPPLRERLDDLPLLAQYFLRQLKFADYTEEQAALLVRTSGCDRCHWPGNVRDFVNVLERAVALTPTSSVMGLLSTLTDLIGQLQDASSEAEKEELIAALNRSEGNQTKAAEDLGINRTTLRYRMQRHGLC